MPISPSLFSVHRIGGEGRVEHVCAVDLGREVAVVPGVITADQVAESCLTVSYGLLVGGRLVESGIAVGEGLPHA